VWVTTDAIFSHGHFRKTAKQVFSRACDTRHQFERLPVCQRAWQAGRQGLGRPTGALVKELPHHLNMMTALHGGFFARRRCLVTATTTTTASGMLLVVAGGLIARSRQRFFSHVGLHSRWKDPGGSYARNKVRLHDAATGQVLEISKPLIQG